jgi:hypothetical protein
MWKEMRVVALVVAITWLLIAVSWASSATIPKDAFKYEGWFEPPVREAPGNLGSYQYTKGGLTVVPDCMGRPDPTPDDGYPGCLLILGAPAGKDVVGLMDVPTPGTRAVTVIPQWSLGAWQFSVTNSPNHFSGNLHNVFDVAYDPGSDCKLWWSYIPYYANGVVDDTPFLGYSSCDPANPTPQGGWHLPRIEDEAGRNATFLNKAGWYFTLLPASQCVNLFDIPTKCFLLGAGKTKGARKSSAGPAFAVIGVPTDLTNSEAPYGLPLVYYPHPIDGEGNYPKWWETILIENEVAYQGGLFLKSSFGSGGEYIETADGEVFVEIISEPQPQPDGVYPNITAGQVRYDGDPTTPPSDFPLSWYGVNDCNGGAQIQQPSFHDFKRERTGTTWALADTDCALGHGVGSLVCPGGGTGPRTSQTEHYIQLYDPADIQKSRVGAVKPWEVQPYAKISLDQLNRFGGCQRQNNGTAYDPVGQLLYVVMGANSTPRIHVYRIGTGHAPDTECDVAAGDSCVTDPTNCGTCPICPPGSAMLDILQAGQKATVECRVE